MNPGRARRCDPVYFDIEIDFSLTENATVLHYFEWEGVKDGGVRRPAFKTVIFFVDRKYDIYLVDNLGRSQIDLVIDLGFFLATLCCSSSALFILRY